MIGKVSPYDTLIVGAGSAGCVLAGRLSADPARRVLLLEAGGEPPLGAVIPSDWPSLFDTEVDWASIPSRKPAAATGGSSGPAAGCWAARLAQCHDLPARPALGL